MCIRDRPTSVHIYAFIREAHFSDTDDDDKSDYSSICGVPKVERNKSVIPDNHPYSFLHPGFYSYLKR